ncbi:MAG: peptidylprolyl isomerase [Nitrospira sp.]|nr:peptidylprolyl isomerase [Nitrospira sp.]
MQWLPIVHRPCYIRSMSASLTFKKKNPQVVISTRFGNVTIQFYTDVAPRHVDNFLNLAKIGFYNGTTFHRVIPGFIIQGGDPLSKEADRTLHGTGGPGFGLTPEPSDQPHRRGTVSMAKMPRNEDRTRDVNDNGSQFFICVEDASSLDRTYTVFGKVRKGMDVVDQIVAAERDPQDNPLDPITMTIDVVEE